MEVTLDDDQNDEMTDKIEAVGKTTLEEIFSEAESNGAGSSVRSIWEEDKRNIKS